VEESTLNPPIFPSLHMFDPNLYKIAVCYSYTFLSQIWSKRLKDKRITFKF
jgi:hypothetical protein